MSNTKQPPIELVEKMGTMIVNHDVLELTNVTTATRCAKIAVQYAIDENYQLTEEVEMGLRISEGLKKQNLELRECLQSIVDAQYNKTGTLAELNNRISEAKQLLKRILLKGNSMNNTTENKAKFFAHYWGQKVFKCQPNDGRLKVDGYIETELINNSFLQLKPLSSITDEDAKRLAVILGMNEKNNVDLNVYGRKKYGGVQIKFTRGKWLYSLCLSNDGHAFNGYYERYGSQHFNPLTIEASDFLRSKGYAVSWMGISVQKQVEYGWIKLQDHE